MFTFFFDPAAAAYAIKVALKVLVLSLFSTSFTMRCIFYMLTLYTILGQHKMTRQNRFYFLTLTLTIMTTILTGCFMGAGTHGSIKSYAFSCNKDTLQNAIMTVVKNNANISRDTSLDYLGSSPMLDNNIYDSTGYHNYPAGDNYYNDIKHYVTIKISSEQEINEYTFRYYGPDEDWKKLTTSGIFICYAHDKDGNGGSGNEGINWRTGKLKKKLTDLFEKELVQKVDSILKTTHTEIE